MAKFCGNCGTQNEDAANVCGNCGTPFEAAPVAVEAAPVAVVADAEKQAKLKKLAILIGAGVAGLIVVVYVIWLILHLLSPKPVLDTFMDGLFKCNGEKIVGVMAECQLEQLEEYDIDAEDRWGDVAESFVEMMEDEVGSDPKFSFTVEDEEKVKKNKYDDLFGEDYEDYMEDNDITEVYAYDLEIKAEKKGDDEKQDLKIYMVKEKGSWKVYDITD